MLLQGCSEPWHRGCQVQERPCYAYAVRGTASELGRWAQKLGTGIGYWVADASQLTMGRGIPRKWKGQGAIFGSDGELRWWKDGDEYRGILLTERPVPDLRPLSGSWTTDEAALKFFLQDLMAANVRPNFDKYPHGHEKGCFTAKLYKRDGIITFISLRTLEGGQL